MESGGNSKIQHATAHTSVISKILSLGTALQRRIQTSDFKVVPQSQKLKTEIFFRLFLGQIHLSLTLTKSKIIQTDILNLLVHSFTLTKRQTTGLYYYYYYYYYYCRIRC